MHNTVKLGLKENWKLFTILVIVNAFVGGMVGLERTIFPMFAEQNYNVNSHRAILSFITVFGFTKAFTNYYAGKLINIYGRKKLLVLGWFIAIPIPFLLMYAPTWNWVIFANVLLGIQQGITWSCTIIMKIDIVGEKNRGLAMGLNEFAGYLSVGIIAYLSGWIANRWGITPYPFYLGIFLAFSGFFISLLGTKDTKIYVHTEILNQPNTSQKTKNIFIETTFKNKNLSSITQAGLVNNLNDGMIWGLLPILLAHYSYHSEDIGLITAIYPAVWGLAQIITGKLSDTYSKKMMIFWGMLLQGLAILGFPYFHDFTFLIILSVTLGIGTALVYPTFFAAIAEVVHPSQRAESMGIFRLWRDLGYAFGAIISGITADLFGINFSIILIAFFTLFSALIVFFRMR